MTFELVTVDRYRERILNQFDTVFFKIIWADWLLIACRLANINGFPAFKTEVGNPSMFAV